MKGLVILLTFGITLFPFKCESATAVEDITFTIYHANVSVDSATDRDIRFTKYNVNIPQEGKKSTYID